MDYQKNVPIDARFGDRLALCRGERGLTKPELAEKAGLSERTIRDLEAARRNRIQEKTLILLAEALEIRPAVLLNHYPQASGTADDVASADADRLLPERSSRRLQPWIVTVVVLLVVVSGTAVVFWNWSCDHAKWELRDYRLHVRDAVFGIRLWDSGDLPRVSSCMDCPWSDRYILVGLGSRAANGGRLLCLDRSNADTVWAVQPDIQAIVRAFGEDVVYAGSFNCNMLATSDLDGDGQVEVVAGFRHGLLFPHAICVVDRQGQLESQYVNRGHLREILVSDIDGDGKDEIFATGANNALAYQGGTAFILDERHRNGASVDEMSFPLSSEPDSALARLVLPRFPEEYMKPLSTLRLTARIPKAFSDARGRRYLSILVGDLGKHTMAVKLDTNLRILDCFPTDDFLAAMKADWPDSLWRETGPADPQWRADWLAGHRRFEAGHWPPPGYSLQ